MTNADRKFITGRVVGVATCVSALATSILRPPAFWLIGVGILLILTTAIVNGRRTGIWFHTPWEPGDRDPLPPLEASLGLAGLLLMLVPLAVAGAKAVGW